MAKILRHKKDKLYYVFDNSGKFVSKTDDYNLSLNLYKSYVNSNSSNTNSNYEDEDDNEYNYVEIENNPKLTKEEKKAAKEAAKEAKKKEKEEKKAAKKAEKEAKKEEKKKYFTEDSLKSALGDSGMKQMESITINSGEAFLNGETTNTQTGEVTNDNEITLDTININDYVDYTPSGMSDKINTLKTAGSTLTNAAAAGLGTYGMGKELVMNAPEIVTTLSTAIISKVTEIVTKEATQLVTDYLSKHAQYAISFPTKITSYAMEKFNKDKISVADALKEMTSSAEGRAEKTSDKNSEKSKSEFMAKISANSKEFVNKMNNYVNTGTSYIGMVTSYIQNGPEWVTNQVDKQIGKLLEGAKKEIDKQWEKDKEAYDSKAQDLGDKVGAEMAKKFNNSIRKAQKKQAEKINTQKVKVKAKLIAVTSKAASLLGSMMGQYIPIPDMV